MSVAEIQAGAVADLLAAAVQALLTRPLWRRLGPQGRRRKREHDFQASFDEHRRELTERLSDQISNLRSWLRVTSKSPLAGELDAFFHSVTLGSLLRQSIGIRLIDGPDAVATRILGPVGVALRTSSPAVYAVQTDVPKRVANLIALTVNDLASALALDEANISPDLERDILVHEARAQMDSISRTVELLAGPNLTIDDFATFPDRYRLAVRKAFSRIPTPHWDGEPRVPIDRAYIPAKFRPSDGADAPRPVALQGALTHARNDSPPTVDQSLAPMIDRQEDRVVLLGDPGAGKTTFTAALLFRTAGDSLASDGVGRVPFLIVLRDYRKKSMEATDSLTFAEYLDHRIAEQYQVRPPHAYVEFCLLAGQALVVFDGLDEILDIGERRDIVDRIEVFCALYPNSRVLVTSRRKGYKNAPLDTEQFQCYEILPFSAPDIRRYIAAWFSLDDTVPPGDRRAHQRTFTSSAESLDAVLITNPLTLALLCNLFKASGYQPLPQSRAEIYEKCSLTLYHRWDFRRGIGEIDFDRDVLPVIAYCGHKILGDPSLDAGLTERQLVSTCIEYLVPRKYSDFDEGLRFAQELITHCVGRAWVFTAVSTNEDGEELFHFTHRTFLEYFAALHLVRSVADPKGLADLMWPWVAAGERAVVCQMAFEIKARQLDDAPESMTTAILSRAVELGLGRESSVRAIEFLCQEAAVVPIGQNVLAGVVRLALELPAAELTLAVAELARCRGGNRRVVDRLVQEHAEASLSAGAADAELLADVVVVCRTFAAARPSGPEREMWCELVTRVGALIEETEPLGLRGGTGSL